MPRYPVFTVVHPEGSVGNTRGVKTRVGSNPQKLGSGSSDSFCSSGSGSLKVGSGSLRDPDPYRDTDPCEAVSLGESHVFYKTKIKSGTKRQNG